MPRIDPRTLAPLGTNARARARSRWPRCRACALPLHPSLAGAGTHALCTQLPPTVWDKLAGWAS